MRMVKTMDRNKVSKRGSTKAASYELTGGDLHGMQRLYETIVHALDRADIVCGEQNGTCIEGCPFGKKDKCSMAQGREIYGDAVTTEKPHG
jgi:hypothetical protein